MYKYHDQPGGNRIGKGGAPGGGGGTGIIGAQGGGAAVVGSAG